MEKDKPLFAEERQEEIVVLLEKQPKIYVPDLCEIFNVSPATIRNDLRELDAKGKLKRTHGGAIQRRKVGFEADSDGKMIDSCDEKKRIAQLAETFIEDGDIIALDAGTTTYELAKLIKKKKNITVITNDIRIIFLLEKECSSKNILIGGEVRQGLYCCVGPMAIKGLSLLHVDKAFMGTNAFSIETGFSTPDMNTAEVKRKIIKCASKVIMLSDSSKIGNESFVRFADLAEVDVWVVDKNIESEMADILRKAAPNMQIYEV